MNILLENGNINTPFTEGTGNILLTHAKALVEKGHKVVILTRRKSSITGKKYPKSQEISGIKIYRWANYLDLYFTFKKIVKKEKIDLIHIFSKGLRPLRYIKFLKKSNKPIVFSSVGFPSTEEDPQKEFESNPKTQKKLIEFIQNVDAFVVTSKYLFEDTLHFKKDNCLYLPYGIDLKRFSPLEIPKKSPQRRIVYLRSPTKELLQAFKEIKNKFENVCFVFNKDYVQKNVFLKEFVIKNRDNIKLIPELKDIAILFRNVEIVIDTHNNQKYLECASPPLLLLEAMACGKKVISTKIGEIEEFIVNEENGFLVEENTPKQISLAIKKALGTEIEIGKSARKTMEGRYAIKEVIKDYAKLYAGLIEGGN
jgi:glycosyltransferase involved in cell wall biosynthesis